MKFWVKFEYEFDLKFEISDGKNPVKFGGRTFLPAREAQKYSGRLGFKRKLLANLIIDLSIYISLSLYIYISLSLSLPLSVSLSLSLALSISCSLSSSALCVYLCFLVLSLSLCLSLSLSLNLSLPLSLHALFFSLTLSLLRIKSYWVATPISSNNELPVPTALCQAQQQSLSQCQCLLQ